MFAYRLGFPGWRLYAKLGGQIKIRVNVIMDEEVGVFVATSPDLQGLVCESDTVSNLKSSVEMAAIALLERKFKKQVQKQPPIADMRLMSI